MTMKSRRSFRSFRGTARPLILGHRGYSALYPENTLLAFREAMTRGADGIELDVQKSADGSYVVIHDATVNRVSRSAGAVGAMTLQAIRAVDVGRGERIPTLDEALDLLPPGAFIDVELKDETLRVSDCRPIVALLDARVPRRRLMVSSFEPALLKPLRAQGIRVGLLLGEEVQARGAVWLVTTLLVLRPQYLNLPVQMFGLFGRHKTMFFLRVLRALGFSLLFWTVDTPAEAEAIRGLASVIVTNEVEVMAKLLGRA
jgi:glycerophosphoryl diester phosphodiesterase